MSFGKSFRRIVATLLVLMTISTFIILPTYADYDEIDEPAQYYGVVQVSTLNVRQSASMDAGVITTLPYGTRVRVNWIEPGWVCVAYNNDGLIGYVSADYLSVYDGTIPEASEGGQAVCDIAAQFLGVPYVWGGTSLTNGADCSGFIMSVYAHFGYSLPHSSSALRSVGRGVSYAEAQPGDIICYSGHVAIYIGGGAIVHASNERDGIKISSNAAYTTILAVRRVV